MAKKPKTKPNPRARRSYVRTPTVPVELTPVEAITPIEAIAPFNAITPIEYGGLQQAYDHFNLVLFDGTLGDVFITYQRRGNSFGYFSPDRFSGRVGASGKHELALNPDRFIGQTDEQIMQTLVHEMAHVWQLAHGKPAARGYHNKQWAVKMKSIGLQPSSTGMVGGKETGQRMSDYPIPGGPFTQAFAALAATGWKLNLQSAHQAGKPKGPSSKTKFVCRHCGWILWGKPDSLPICGPCILAAAPPDLHEILRAYIMPGRDAAHASAVPVQSYDQAAE